MKRILFVHQVSTVGGASYCLLNLLKAVDRSRFEPVALLKNEGPLVQEIEKLGIVVHLMPSMDVSPYNTSFLRPGTWATYASVFSSRRDFKKHLLSIKPDFLYLNNSMLWPYLIVAKRVGVKTIVHVREHWPMEEHTKQLGWLQNAVRKYSDRVIAINSYSALMVADKQTKPAVVYDWIDFTGRYVEHSLDDIFGEDVSGKKVYLYTGGMQPIKGCREVLMTFSRIKDKDARMLALGIDNSQAEITRMVNEDSRIVTTPATYALKDLFEKCYVVLSYFTIPHANLALAEAVTLKVPVIAASTEESLEYSNNGRLAILFKMNDIDDFEQKVMSFDKLRPALKQRLDEESNSIAELFGRERNEKEFRNVLNSLD